MKKIFVLFISLLTTTLLPAKVTAPSLSGRAGGGSVSYVSTLVGTMSKHSLSTGNTYPAIALPWGMNFWTPQTGRMGDGWAYVYTEDKIRGIKQTHQPSPWINDYGQFAIMPTTRTVFKEDDRASWFSHKAEVATPYYYKVYLADWDVVAELTPTTRAAMMRLTYPETTEPRVVIDPFDKGSYVAVDAQHRRLLGYTTKNSGGVPQGFKNYFIIEFSHPISFVATADGDKLQEGRVELMADHATAVVGFPSLRRGEQVTLRIASSFISFEQAERNLQELGNSSFDQICEGARQRWDDVLGRIEVEDDNIDHLRTFYSCLYRSVLFPRSFFEYDAAGQPIHYSPHTGKVCSGYYFTDTGFWDTFRCLFPLLNLVYPEMNLQMQEGLVNCYKESGFLPEWASPGHRGCMVGNNSASVVADAYLKLSVLDGLPVKSSPYDIETLWQAVTHGANAVHPQVSSTGRLGFDHYNRLGYVPYDVDIRESVARTLEYAYDDWCIYQLGKKLGKKEKELKPFREHALNYRNVFDPETKLMRGRNKDGKFQSPFNPLKWGDAFTEGNAWHYTWSVFHDPEGLIRLMGGKNVFVAMLDSVFNVPPLFDESYYGGVIHEIREMQIMNMGNYAHGNQPIQHMIYLYDWAGQPWKTQQRVREVMDKFYTPLPDGYCGDEDNGQTSAWYVFSALGFYPVCPGSGEYALGTPYFRKTTLHLSSGKNLTIDASVSDGSPVGTNLPPYIQRMTFNGQPYARNYLRHEDLLRGGSLRFDLGSQPNRSRGIGNDDAPYSFSK
ncbi:MAG: GH92 family glycosyl hydrolase [Bacteroidaceae bacterium]|nr:GH92 family glycosyl hydrolase [Bacteroidaceae bacterium]